MQIAASGCAVHGHDELLREHLELVLHVAVTSVAVLARPRNGGSSGRRRRSRGRQKQPRARYRQSRPELVMSSLLVRWQGLEMLQQRRRVRVSRAVIVLPFPLQFGTGRGWAERFRRRLTGESQLRTSSQQREAALDGRDPAARLPPLDQRPAELLQQCTATASTSRGPSRSDAVRFFRAFDLRRRSERFAGGLGGRVLGTPLTRTVAAGAKRSCEEMQNVQDTLRWYGVLDLLHPTAN